MTLEEIIRAALSSFVGADGPIEEVEDDPEWVKEGIRYLKSLGKRENNETDL